MLTCTIEFNKSNRKYKSSDVITCVIQIDVTDIFRANSLWIRFKGAAHTEWTAKRSNLIPWQTYHGEETFTGDQIFFDSTEYLERWHNQERDFVAIGAYEYTVRYTLPRNLPPSFSHENGSIEYTATVVYETPSDVDKVFTENFYILPDMRIAEFPQFLERVRLVKKKSFGFINCGLLDPHLLYIVNILPKSGYEPGETIILTVELISNSWTDIRWVRVRLKEKVTFRVKNPKPLYKTQTNTILSHKFEEGCRGQQNKIFQTTFFLDPNYDWKYLQKYGIIACQYYVETKAYASCFRFNPVHTTDITIGTLPCNDPPDINSENVSAVFNPSIRSGETTEQPLPSYTELLLMRSPRR